VLIWAAIGLIVLTLANSASNGVLMFVRANHEAKLNKHDETLTTITNALERITTQLDAMQKWQDSVNVDDRYTTTNAEADRLINVTERGKLRDAVETLRKEQTQYAKEFADHRATAAHTAASARMDAIEARLALLEHMRDRAQK
jgi:hypothetical protein